MLTGNEVMRKYRIRKKLRRLSEVPVIGNIIKAVNPEHMFDEPLDDNKEE